ncbi:MAG: hypothetical protein D3920_02615 [Candidatus Electrothrix sp. AW2]|nr:hypothetical protein [Candidatus Electrothrix gigas]MCI5191976.1 hypothetical protein [Candidatus Electrothrix gigas]
MADATTAVSGTVKGIAGTAVTTAKAAAVSPIFAVVALGGIIAFEWWKGSKDAQKFTTAESCSEDASN